MDVRSDTSSAHMSAPWSILGHGSHQSWENRSLPTSTYSLRQDAIDADRAAAFRRLSTRDRSHQYRRPTRSIASQQSTLPSQPVIVRVHSAEASSHAHPSPRVASVPTPSSPIKMSNRRDLPPASDFSIDGILNAIHPDIEETLHAIAEIMGRSRFTLANEYGSHMPPQGEIRAQGRIPGENPLLPVEEASSSNERLAGDNVIIVDEDASVVDGSVAGSRAYSLLERLRAVPRTTGHQSSTNTSHTLPSAPHRSSSSPSALHSPTTTPAQERRTRPSRTRSNPRALLQNASAQTGLSTAAVLSETYLSPSANGVGASSPPLISEGGYERPLYSYEEASLFEATSNAYPQNQTTAFLERLRQLLPVEQWSGLLAWLRREHGLGDGAQNAHDRDQNASGLLREILTQRSTYQNQNSYMASD